MTTKKFVIEVEEGNTHCDDKCPLKHSGVCLDIGCELEQIFDFVDCYKYNLATMKITELPSLEYASDDYVPMDIRLTPRDLTFKY